MCKVSDQSAKLRDLPKFMGYMGHVGTFVAWVNKLPGLNVSC